MKTSVRIQPIATGATAYKSAMDDSKDCVIRALANATEKPYTEIHAEFKAKGRKSHTGVHIELFHDVYRKHAMQVVGAFGTTRATKWYAKFLNIPTEKGITIGNALKKFSAGKYIFITRQHALAVIDGEIVDTHPNKSNNSVCLVYSAE